MSSDEAVLPIDAAHVWIAAFVAVVALALATLVLCGFSLSIMRKMVIGADNRASTSKFQAAAWTYAISFALLTLFVGHLFYADFDPAWDSFLDEGLNSDYLWLLGIPSAGLVGAGAITPRSPTTPPPSRRTRATQRHSRRELGNWAATTTTRTRSRRSPIFSI